MSANGNVRDGLRGSVDAVVHSLRETGRLAESIGEGAARLGRRRPGPGASGRTDPDGGRVDRRLQ